MPFLKRLSVQYLLFIAVGGVATAIHFAVALTLIAGSVTPLVANAGGFATGFQFSFLGHSRFTFAGTTPPGAFYRFALCATGGFACNEAFLATLLELTALSETAAVGVALATVSVLTFLVARSWTFRVPAASASAELPPHADRGDQRQRRFRFRA